MITNLKGDVTKSDVKGLRILTHIVNSDGLWGSGVVIPIGRKWPHVRESYIDWYQSTIHSCEFTDIEVPWLLGEVQFIKADDNTIVANMLAQKSPGCHETINMLSWPPIRMEAVRECMGRVADLANDRNASIITPKFGSLRAGGDFNEILKLIESEWSDINVYIYEYEEK